MVEVNYFNINLCEIKHQLRDLRTNSQCKLCSPGDFRSLVKATEEGKNCWNCPCFDKQFDFCRNHLEFIFSPGDSVCHDFDSMVAYYGSHKKQTTITYTIEEVK